MLLLLLWKWIAETPFFRGTLTLYHGFVSPPLPLMLLVSQAPLAAFGIKASNPNRFVSATGQGRNAVLAAQNAKLATGTSSPSLTLLWKYTLTRISVSSLPLFQESPGWALPALPRVLLAAGSCSLQRCTVHGISVSVLFNHPKFTTRQPELLKMGKHPNLYHFTFLCWLLIRSSS